MLASNRTILTSLANTRGNDLAENLIRRRNFLNPPGRPLPSVPAVASLSNLAPAELIAEPPAKPRPDPQAPPKSANLTLNIRDYGATGDGTTKDTAAIQQTIDRCALFGGGEVLIPAGNYLTGAIQLRSRTLLRLAPEATLTGSPTMTHHPY